MNHFSLALRRRFLAGALAVATLAGVAACGGDDNATTTPTEQGSRAAPVKASADALKKVAQNVGHPVYWVAGTTPETYELTQTSNRRIYIRYLPKDVELGDPRPNFLTVGTYPQDKAFETVQAGSKRAGAAVARLPNGGLAVSQKERPTSVFFSYPDSPVLVEVYDPTAGEAARLVSSGAVQPIS